jgi:ActR/RegA family two-component response regulator
MTETNRKNILILEADRDVSELFARAIEVRRDCKCYLAGGEEEAFDLMQDILFVLALVDLSIAMEGGFKLLKKINSRYPGMVIIVNAFLHQKEHLNQAYALGARGHIFKPIKVDSFRKKVEEFFPLAQNAMP